MASIEHRVSKSGVETWRVAWREGGRRAGRRDGETCDAFKVARMFKAMVEAAGEHRPEGYPQGCRGVKLAPAEARINPATGERLPTLGDVFEEYLGSLKKADERQIEGYRRLFNRHVRPARVRMLDKPTGRVVGPLGSLPVDEFTAEVDEAWVAWWASRTYVHRRARIGADGKKIPAELRHYSAKTIHNVHGSTLSPALARAARLGTIDANPCAGVDLPKPDVKAVNLDEVPTGDELNEWIGISYEISELAGDITTVAIGTGLRWSEITALRPCDIDLERRTLRVAQVIKEDKNRQLYIAPYGKTDSALRTIRINKTVCKLFARLCKGLGGKDLIFQRTTGGILRSQGFYGTHWSKVKVKAKARGMKNATIHKFRHSHATELLAENVSMDSISKRLGHRSILITTLLYGHLQPEADERAAEVMEARMTRKKAKKAKRAKQEASALDVAA